MGIVNRQELDKNTGQASVKDVLCCKGCNSVSQSVSDCCPISSCEYLSKSENSLRKVHPQYAGLGLILIVQASTAVTAQNGMLCCAGEGLLAGCRGGNKRAAACHVPVHQHTIGELEQAD